MYPGGASRRTHHSVSTVASSTRSTAPSQKGSRQAPTLCSRTLVTFVCIPVSKNQNIVRRSFVLAAAPAAPSALS